MLAYKSNFFGYNKGLSVFARANGLASSKRFFAGSLRLKNIKPEYKKPEFSTEPLKHDYNDNRRRFKQIIVFSSFALIGYAISANYSFMDLITIYTSSNNSQDAKDYKIKLQARLLQLPIVKQMLKKGFVEVIGEKAENGYELLNELGGVAIPPKSYYNPQTKKLVDIVHIGMKLQGYPFMLHGGVSSDIISQFMGKALKFADIDGKERTYRLRSLKTDYKAPVFVNRFIVLRITDIERVGKTLAKCSVEVYSENGKKLLIKGKGKFAVEQN